MIQYQKAEYFKDAETSNRILNCKSAIQNYDHDSWNEVAKDLCHWGIMAKFDQNPTLQNLDVLTKTQKLKNVSTK